MLFYHLDRDNMLKDKAFMTLLPEPSDCLGSMSELLEGLFPLGLSSHGEKYFYNTTLLEKSSDKVAELIFEYIRLKWFPHLPSRYQAYFAFLSYEDLIKSPLFDISRYIYEIETDNYFIADMNLLSGAFFRFEDANYTNIPIVAERAKQYWSGQYSDNPQPEVLIIPPAKIIRRL